eukprot:12813082-Alexandrium_andersonii.AAC.1
MNAAIGSASCASHCATIRRSRRSLDHPKKQAVARIDTSERRLDPERQAAGSRALTGGLSGRARERIERGSVSSDQMESV